MCMSVPAQGRAGALFSLAPPTTTQLALGVEDLFGSAPLRRRVQAGAARRGAPSTDPFELGFDQSIIVQLEVVSLFFAADSDDQWPTVTVVRLLRPQPDVGDVPRCHGVDASGMLP